MLIWEILILQQKWTILINTLLFPICTDDEEKLLFSNRYYVRQLSVDGSQYDLISDGFRNAIALDYDLQDGNIFVIDTSLSLSRMKLDGSEKEVILSDYMVGAEGIAVDWVGRSVS